MVDQSLNRPPPGRDSGHLATFILETGDLTGVDWTRLHYLALVDYQPGGVALLEPYDVLQAAIALPAATH
jgi:hypothetical protein